MILLFAAIAALAALIIVMTLWPRLLAPILLVAGALFSTPNMLASGTLGLALSLGAAVVAIGEDKSIRNVFGRGSRPIWLVAFWVSVAYVWVAVRISLPDPPAVPGLTKSSLAMLGTLVAAAVVLSNRDRRVRVAKLFVGLVVASCASFCVTAAIWAASGIGAAEVTQIPGAYIGGYGHAFFPFTVTTGSQTIEGIRLLRFAGFGREPGWMAMYASFAFFLAPRIGWSHKWLRAALFVGVLGTVSTAGFGVFVMVLAFEIFMRKRADWTPFKMFFSRIVGLVVGYFAYDFAVNAPFLGLNAKGSQNAVSLKERTAATDAGWRALQEHPLLGGGAVPRIGGVNLIAAIANYGLIFSVCIALAALGALWAHPRWWLAASPVFVVFLTLAMAQPSFGSAWAFVPVMIALAVTLPVSRADEESDSKLADSQTPTPVPAATA